MSAVAPSQTRTVIGNNLNGIENFQLRFYTLLPEPPAAGKKAEELSGIESSAKTFFEKRFVSELLGNLQTRRLQLLKDLAAASRSGISACYSFKMELTENFVTGMAQRNSLDSGISLLRPWGIPFVPDSTVKGVLKNTIGEVLCGIDAPSSQVDDKLDSCGLLPLFGEGDAPGRIIFFDAMPASDIRMEADLMNPHYRDYYAGQDNAVPAGYHNPVPVYFMTVKTESTFDFAFALKEEVASMFPLKNATKADRSQFDMFKIDDRNAESFLTSLMKAAGLYHGFGSQTRKGLGHMTLDLKGSKTFTG